MRWDAGINAGMLTWVTASAAPELGAFFELGSSQAAWGSSCPKNASNTASASYGYVPALDLLIDRLASTLK